MATTHIEEVMEYVDTELAPQISSGQYELETLREKLTSLLEQQKKEMKDYVNENYSRSTQPLYAHVDAKKLAEFINQLT